VIAVIAQHRVHCELAFVVFQGAAGAWDVGVQLEGSHLEGAFDLSGCCI
jgi:hypothetical protein